MAHDDAIIVHDSDQNMQKLSASLTPSTCPQETETATSKEEESIVPPSVGDESPVSFNLSRGQRSGVTLYCTRLPSMSSQRVQRFLRDIGTSISILALSDRGRLNEYCVTRLNLALKSLHLAPVSLCYQNNKQRVSQIRRCITLTEEYKQGCIMTKR